MNIFCLNNVCEVLKQYLIRIQIKIHSIRMGRREMLMVKVRMV